MTTRRTALRATGVALLGSTAGCPDLIPFVGDEPSGRVLGGGLVSECGEGAVLRSHSVVEAVTEGVTVDELSNYDLAKVISNLA